MPASCSNTKTEMGATAEGQSAERVVVLSSLEESRRATGEAIGRQLSGDCADPSSTIKDVVSRESILFPSVFYFSPTKGSFSPDPSHRFPTLYIPIMSDYLSRSWPETCIAWPWAAMACFSQHKSK